MKYFLLFILAAGCTPVKPGNWPGIPVVKYIPEYTSQGNVNPPDVPLGLAGTSFLLVLNTDTYKPGQVLSTRQKHCPAVYILDKVKKEINTVYLVRIYPMNNWKSVPTRFLLKGTVWYPYYHQL